MNISMSPSHVAVLVPSVEKAAQVLKQYKFQIGEVEDFEETREIYIEGGACNSLLLMEAKKSGSYRRAMDKRGPGIHHFAIDVLDMEKFLSSLTGSGWLLHLNSLKTLKAYKAAYLARPGFPALIEVQEKKKLMKGEPLFVECAHINFEARLLGMVSAVGLANIVKTSKENPCLLMQNRKIEMKDLF